MLPVTSGGYVEPDTVRERLRADTLVVSVMHANNETGVLQPVLEIGEHLAETKTLFHVDAAQTFGKEVEALRRLKCDFLSISGHKIYGPKGIGALYVRRSAIQKKLLAPLMFGGGQEVGLRPGTLAVPLIVGLGEAAELARKEYPRATSSSREVEARFSDRVGSCRTSDQRRFVEDAIPCRQRQLPGRGQRGAHVGACDRRSRSPMEQPAHRPAIRRAMC